MASATGLERFRALALRLAYHDALQVDTKVLLRRPSEEALRVHRAGEVVWRSPPFGMR